MENFCLWIGVESNHELEYEQYRLRVNVLFCRSLIRPTLKLLIKTFCNDNQKFIATYYKNQCFLCCHFIFCITYFWIALYFLSPKWPYSVPVRDFCPCRVSVAMGDNMSKRLKLISVTEAEMEERSFSNPYPDWDQGVLTSNSGAQVDTSEPFDADGKVRNCLYYYYYSF